ncbi:MAG: hypothetical protein FWE76_05685 [Symbiobacteriaceae bacterium]|nr:hypothetical protein [Symbiobacteriaceae bacterium]
MIQFPKYRLDIDITLPQIGTRIQNAEIDIQMEPSAAYRQFHPLEWKVIPNQAYVDIDMSAWRAEFDVENPVAWSEKIVGEGGAFLARETGWRAKNGDLFYFATPGDLRPLLDFAMHYFALQDERYASWNVDWSPKNRPQITAVMDVAQRFDVAPLSDSAYSFSITASPAVVEIYLAVQPETRMRATPIFDERV